MTHVHYKFSSKLSYDTVVFDGPHITLGELKKQIMCREKLRAGDCDLQITNAQTKEEYTDDDGPIPKGSSVIVRRIPTRGGKSSSKTSSKTTNIERSVSQSHHSFDVAKAMDDHSSPTTLHFFSKMANLAEADVSEEDKIKVMLNQSIYDSMNFNKKFGSVLPANYTCYRCGNTGHHIRNCPSSGQDKNFEPLPKIKKSTGIPRSFMVEVDDPNTKGAMLTNCGRYAIPAIDAEAYAVGKKERPPFVPQEKPKSEAEEDPVPDELLCLICHELLSDAVVIPCCGNSYCDDCIRTTLLDSEEHTCPTCGQQNVSPDTLIANKFLRQAVNNFKKERGYSKSKTQICDSSQSQNPTPAPSPVSTPPPPPLTVQSQPQKQHQSSYNQQAADTQPSFGKPPVAAVGPTSACLTSVQTEQSRLDIPDKEAKEEAQDDSAAVEEDTAASADAAIAVPPAVASDHDPTAAPSQLTPLANDTTVAEQPQSDHQKSSSGPAPGTSTCWGSSSSGCHTGGWTESQQLTSSPSSTYSAIAPPLFPSPLYHPYLTAHHSHSSYPPGYPPTPPIWTLPCPQGAPIPSLCSSTPTPSIPALIPEEWHRYQRKNKERSPDRGSSYRHSSSRSYSTSSKSKSSHTYSRSSSRSRSRSRSKSKGRSRPRSPYSHHRALHTHSHRSYSYGYKRLRSPTPSSSSSPQVGHHSRATSPSDHRKNRHHSHHHSRKSASSGYSSTRRGVRSKREEGQNAGSPSSSRFNQSSSMDLDRERHQQWNKQYSEWCEKYFSSYINHFHQLPLSFINLPPPPQFEGSKYYSHAKSDSCCRPSALMDDRSPPSKSSTDSRSPPSHSSSSSRSTPSHSSSDSCSSPSNTSNNSLSPPSQLLEYQRHKSGRSSFKRGSEEEEELQGKSKNSKQAMTGNLGNHSSKDSEQRPMKKDGDEGRREEPSSLHAPNPADDNQKVETGPITGPHSVSVRDEAIFQPLKSLDDSCHRKRKEKSDLVDEKRCIRDKDSKSRHDMVRQYKAKSNKAGDDTEYRNHGSSKAPDLSSMGDRKTKGETQEKRVHSEGTPPNPFEIARQKSEPKKESKTWPFRERGIWEGRITVKPPKKISININLDGKRKEGQIEDQKNITGEPKGEMEEVGEGRNLNKEETFEVHEMMKSTRHGEGVFEHKIKPGEGDLKEYKERAVIGDDASPRVMWTNTGGEEGKNVENKQDGDDEGIELWPFVLRGDQEDKESTNLTGEGGRMKESKEEELARDERMSLTGKEEEGAVREENKGPEMGGLVQNSDEWSEAANGGNLPGEWTSEEVKTDGGKRRIKEDADAMSSKSQRSSNNRPSSNVESDSSSSTGDCQERTEDKAAESEDQRVLIQEESEEDEQNEGDVKPQDPFPVGPSPPNMETEGESEVKRQRSVDTTRDESRPMQKEGEKEKHFILSTLDRHVAPSSGKITTDSTLYSNRERERRIEMERCRDRERGRDSERSGDRHRETRSTKEEDRGRERRPQKKTHPSSSHSSPYSTSQDMERRDRQRRDDHRKSPAGKHSGSGSSEKISTGGATKVPDRHKASAYRDKSLDRKPKDKNPHHDYRDHRDAPGNRPAGSRHSSPSLPHCKQRDPLKSSPDLKSALKRSRDENKEEKEEWKRDKVNEVMRGSHSKSTAEKWEGVAVEEGERPSSSFFSFSSSSSPAGQESSKEDRRKERKRREKKEAAVELPEERELKKHGHTKKSKRGKDGREAESGGDVDNRWKEEDDHTELCSVMLF